VWEIVRQDDWLEVFIAPEEDAPTRSFLLQAGGMPRLQIGDAEPRRWPDEVDSETITDQGLWQAEMRIPFSALEMNPEPGASWLINIVRHRAAKPGSPGEEDSSIVPEGEFAPMRLVEEPVARETVTAIRLHGVARGNQTVEHGFATILRLRPEIETNRDSRNVAARVAVEADGEVVTEYERALRRLPGYWSPAGPVQMDLGRAFEGDLQVTVSAVADDGSLDVAKTFVIDERGRVEAH
jgi:hypothetical protein